MSAATGWSPVVAGRTVPLPHCYVLALRAGEVARIVLDQRETDLFVEVTGPAGVPTRYDERDRGLEFVTLFATVPAKYTIEVGCVHPDGVAAEYDLSVDVSERKTLQDDLRIAAEAESTHGKRLARVRDADSYQQALQHHTRAAELWKLLDERRAEATALLNIADIHYFQSRLEKAVDAYNGARRVFQAVGDNRGIAEALNGLGASLWQLGRIDEAVEAFNLALEGWRAVRHPGGEAATVSNLGILSYETGDWQQALGHFLSARQIARSLKNELGDAYACNNLAVVYNALRQHRNALAYLKVALRLFRRCGNGPAAARALLLLGQIHWFLNNAELAARCGQEALAQLASSGDRRSRADTLRHLGQVAETNGRLDLARARYSEAFDTYREIRNPQGEAAALHGLGSVAFLAGDDAAALRLLANARRIRQSIGATDGEAETLFVIACLAERRGRLRSARRHVEAAIRRAEELRSRIAGLDFRTSYFSSKHDYYGFHIQLMMRFHRLNPGAGFDVLAFEASERARARGLLDLLNQFGQSSPFGVVEEFADQERQLKRQIRLWSHRRARAMSNGDDKEALRARQQLTSLMDAYQELDSRVRAATSVSSEAVRPQPLTLRQAQQQLLDKETTLLHYALADTRCFLWVIAAEGVRSFDLGPKDEIVETARRLYDLVSTSGTRSRRPDVIATWDETAAVLGRLLLPADALNAETSRLVFASEGILQYIPFAALPEPGGQGVLIERCEIVCVPSISTIASLRSAISGRAKASREVALIADPVFDVRDPRVTSTATPVPPPSRILVSRLRGGRRLGRLPFSRTEAEYILTLIPPGQGEMALDFAACEAAVNSEWLGSYRIVHFASHAVVDDQNPELSALVVSLVGPDAAPQDGFIPVSRILQLRLQADLVVLSACKTGLGKDVRGEGMVGLTRAFMSAGAARILVSLWKVDDEATCELMKHFYDAMLGEPKLSPGAALRAAQLAMLRQKRWKSPYYWSGFTLQGEWQ